MSKARPQYREEFVSQSSRLLRYCQYQRSATAVFCLGRLG
jgi:hypothetical protein